MESNWTASYKDTVSMSSYGMRGGLVMTEVSTIKERRMIEGLLMGVGGSIQGGIPTVKI